MRFTTSLLSFLLVTAAACSSSYVPRHSGRVATVIDGGALAYSRDGRIYAHGAFGGGLVEAVQGVPAATRAANTFRNRMIGGFISVVGGMLCSMVAITYAANESYHDRSANPGLTTSLACLGVTTVGVGFLMTGQPYMYDAINIFNDAVPSQPPRYQGPGRGPGYSQRSEDKPARPTPAQPFVSVR